MLCIENIGELTVVPKGPVCGTAMDTVPRIHSAALLLDGPSIKWFGPQHQLQRPSDCETLDAQGACVVPGLVDCHTHTVFAGSREHEFVQRIQNKSYAEIARSGGGINVTVEAVRKASRAVLVELALPRLRRMLANGVTTVEIKSGYGLSVADELKMLEAIRDLRQFQPIEIVSTYLAAHTAPSGCTDPNAYLDELHSDSLLNEIRTEGLAEFCDVFCDATAFDPGQSCRVLEAGKRNGLRPKIHADQFTCDNSAALASRLGAVSADHLDKIDDAGLAAMKSAGTVAVLLPGSSYFLGQLQAPARRILAAGVPVAVASNFNPGSSMIESLPLVMNIACTQMRMTPIEVLVAATANAAAAIDRHDRLGAIAMGMQADVLILDVPSPEAWMYEPGRNCVRAVIKAGKVVHSRPN